MRERNQALDVLAAVLMVIDHIGAVLFPDIQQLRWIGRLSFPLFAFGVARGVEYTSDFRRYFFRIIAVAVVSQPVYYLAFGSMRPNPLFTLAWGAVCLWLWRREGVAEKWMLAALIILAYWYKGSYGLYGILTIVVYGFYHERKSLCFYGQVLLQVMYYCNTGSLAQALSLIAFPIAGVEWKKRITLPRYFFYFFYPLHLLVLVGVRAWFFAR